VAHIAGIGAQHELARRHIELESGEAALFATTDREAGLRDSGRNEIALPIF